MIISGNASAPTPIKVLVGKTTCAPGVLDALAEREPVTQVGDVGRDLHRIAQARAMVGEHALDLVVGVAALLQKVAVVPDVAARSVLVLGADAGEIDELGVADPVTVTASEKMPRVHCCE